MKKEFSTRRRSFKNILRKLIVFWDKYFSTHSQIINPIRDTQAGRLYFLKTIKGDNWQSKIKYDYGDFNNRFISAIDLGAAAPSDGVCA